jgi:hypothetical protein
MTAGARTAFLVDVDDTLLDNDRFGDDLSRRLDETVGRAARDRYGEVLEARRRALGFADYLGTLQVCREADPRDQRLLALSFFLLEYPFARRLYPGALDVLARLGRAGPTVIVSDGDGVFQPWKIARSGIADAVDGRVLVFLHKEQELDEIERRVPADRYVAIDDKEWLLAAMKRAWGERVTTVFPRQGHYARDEARFEEPFPDLTIDRIGDLRLADVERAAERTRP